MSDTTTETFPHIGWIDQYGNILEEADAQARLDAHNDGLLDPEETPLELTDLFTKVRTADFWQADLDGTDPGPQPEFEVIEEEDAAYVADDGTLHATEAEAREYNLQKNEPEQAATASNTDGGLAEAEAMMRQAADLMRRADTLLQKVRYGRAAPKA